MLTAMRIFAIVFMALVFLGFVRTKLCPYPAPEKLIPEERNSSSSENPKEMPGSK